MFSSNVMEHVADVSQLNKEIRRVLKPDGFCIHLMPTHVWRLWTSVTSVPACVQYLMALGTAAVPQAPGIKARPASQLRRLLRHFGRHGERGNVISELWLFHPSRWRQIFRADAFKVVEDRPIGIFYTGNTIFGVRLPIRYRKTLARFFGSACHLYIVTPAPSSS